MILNVKKFWPLLIWLVCVLILFLRFGSGPDPYLPKSRYARSYDQVKNVADALDQYYLKHGYFPELPNFESMVSPDSPLVQEDFLARGQYTLDPWGNRRNAFSSKSTYSIECATDPTKKSPLTKLIFRPGERPNQSFNPDAAATSHFLPHAS